MHPLFFVCFHILEEVFILQVLENVFAKGMKLLDEYTIVVYIIASGCLRPLLFSYGILEIFIVDDCPFLFILDLLLGREVLGEGKKEENGIWIVALFFFLMSSTYLSSCPLSGRLFTLFSRIRS